MFFLILSHSLRPAYPFQGTDHKLEVRNCLRIGCVHQIPGCFSDLVVHVTPDVLMLAILPNGIEWVKIERDDMEMVIGQY